MVTETKKVFAIAALIAVTGIGAVELTRNPAQADPMLVAGGAAGYAGERIDGAFQTVAELPPATPFSIPVAAKGDLMPVAYDVAADEPSVVVETRMSNSSILVRMMGYTMAVFDGDTQRSE